MKPKIVAAAASLALALGCNTRGTVHEMHDADATDVHETMTATGPAASAVTEASTPAAVLRAGPTADQTAPPQSSVVLDRTTRTRHMTKNTIEPPPTISQRIAAIVGTLGGLGIAALIALIIICPGAVAAWAIKERSKFKAAFSETAQAIANSGVTTTSKPLSDALNNSQSASTKQLSIAVTTP